MPGKLLSHFGGECDGTHSSGPSTTPPPASVTSDDEAPPKERVKPAAPAAAQARESGSAASERKAPRRKQVRRACVNCRRSKTGCSHERPCRRCVNLNIGDSCVDAPRKRRRDKSAVEGAASASAAVGTKRKRKTSEEKERSKKSRKKTESQRSAGEDVLLTSMLNEASAAHNPSHSLEGLLETHCLPLMCSARGDDFDVELELELELEGHASSSTCSSPFSTTSPSPCDSPMEACGDEWAEALMPQFFHSFMLPMSDDGGESFQPVTFCKPEDIQELKASNDGINQRFTSMLEGINSFSENPDTSF